MYRAVRWAALVLVVASSLRADQHLYVTFAHGQKESVKAAVVQGGGKLKHEFEDLEAVAVVIPDRARVALERNPNVVLLEEDPVREFLTIDLPSQNTPYGVTMVQAPAISPSASDTVIKVGVIDTGVHRDHPDFQGLTITGEPDLGANDEHTWYRDIESHGTHVVGTIAAANNTIGVVGVSPSKVAIHMVKVFGDTGEWVYSSDLLAACRAAANAGCKIISMSLGGSGSSLTEKQGLADLYTNKHVLLVAAAGNSGTTAFSYPASYDSVISVAAIDSSKAVASFSQKNNQVELAAPGVAVLSTVSYVDTTSLTVNGATFDAAHIDLSAINKNISGSIVYGGLAQATNGAWDGKIVLVDRGTNSFYEKVHNVELSGGLACIIANNVSGNFAGTLGDGNSSTILAVSVSQETGTAIKALSSPSGTVANVFTQPASAYDYFDGTSMATPHVSGVAALIWSKYPGATNVQVRSALDTSAEDLGAAGRDTSYGYGLVRASNALAALAALAPPPAADTTAPIITNVLSTVTNSKNGSFDITWTTDELATSDVTVNGTSYPNSTLTKTHKRSFRGTKGATYNGTVTSADGSGNSASAAFPQVKL